MICAVLLQNQTQYFDFSLHFSIKSRILVAPIESLRCGRVADYNRGQVRRPPTKFEVSSFITTSLQVGLGQRRRQLLD